MFFIVIGGKFEFWYYFLELWLISSFKKSWKKSELFYKGICMKEASWNLMVIVSYYEAVDFVKSNLVFVTVLLLIVLVRDKNDLKVCGG